MCRGYVLWTYQLPPSLPVGIHFSIWHRTNFAKLRIGAGFIQPVAPPTNTFATLSLDMTIYCVRQYGVVLLFPPKFLQGSFLLLGILNATNVNVAWVPFSGSEEQTPFLRFRLYSFPPGGVHLKIFFSAGPKRIVLTRWGKLEYGPQVNRTNRIPRFVNERFCFL